MQNSTIEERLAKIEARLEQLIQDHKTLTDVLGLQNAVLLAHMQGLREMRESLAEPVCGKDEMA
jgi:hypothetical protein